MRECWDICPPDKKQEIYLNGDFTVCVGCPRRNIKMKEEFDIFKRLKELGIEEEDKFVTDTNYEYDYDLRRYIKEEDDEQGNQG